MSGEKLVEAVKWLKIHAKHEPEARTLLASWRERSERLVSDLRSRGFHEPQGTRCQHGMSAWVGDHCKYEIEALRPAASAEEEP